MHEVLIGVLAAIATTFVTKILELFKQSKEHKYSLQKEVFIRKLQSAEVAVSQYLNMAYSIGALATLWEESVKNEGEPVEFDVFNSLQESLLTQLNGVQQATSIGNTIFLYFDIDQAILWDKNLIKDMLLKTSAAQASIRALNTQRQIQMENQGTQVAEIALRQIARLEEQTGTKIKQLAAVLNQVQDEMRKILVALRSETKRYEP